MSASRPSVNSSALHVFEILRLVSRTDTPPGVADISRRLDLPTSTVHRAPATLEQSQYLSRLESAPRYKLGPVPQFLTRAVFRQFQLRTASLPFLKRIALETGATTSLGVRAGYYYLRITVAYASNDLYSPGRLGEVKLLHDSLGGRGIFATLLAKDLRGYRRFIEKRYPKAARDLNAMRALLRPSREIGFVAERSDHYADAFALSLPIRNADGEAIASILATGAARTSGGKLLRPGWAKHADDLETMVRSDPVRFRNPFAHIRPEQIVLDVENRVGAETQAIRERR
jgi:IclR family acetate operon transcriptional repressor